MKKISDYLSIVLITYNRSALLDKSLDVLLSSPFKDCSITVLDNHSTDDTRNVVLNYSNHTNLKLVTNVLNIGGNANILRAIEYATKKYIWILADDDTYDFSECDDVIEKICNDDFALLHVGGHKDVLWPQIKYVNVDDAIKGGFPYFKISSFIPANIINVLAFKEYIIDGYNNIVNSYPHMPFLIGVYKNKLPYYISNRKIVLAEIGAQNYSYLNVVEWWISTACKYITTKADRRLFIYSQLCASNAKYKYLKVLKIVFRNKTSAECRINTLLLHNFLFSSLCLPLVYMYVFFDSIKRRIVPSKKNL